MDKVKEAGEEEVAADSEAEAVPVPAEIVFALPAVKKFLMKEEFLAMKKSAPNVAPRW